MIDTSKRFLARSEAVRSWRLKGLLYTAALTWGVVFVFFLLVMASPITGALLGLIAAVISALVYPGSAQRNLDNRLRELHQEKFGETDTYVCEVELTPIGVWVKQMNTQVTHEWESVEEIVETADSVDIVTKLGGVSVRDRAFATTAERRKFIELAQGYLELSRIGDSERDTQLTGG
ncbi:MAG TPA: hypothetical protein VF527_02215 [Pyrinomonadaceae bacterium]